MSVSVELVPLSVLIAASFAGGYKLFDNGKKINNIKFEKTEIPQYVIPTVFADKDTLLKTLDSLGICYSQKAGKIVTALQNSKVEFFKEKDVFNMVITGNIDTKQIQKEYDNITDGYGKIVQSKIINNIKEKVQSSSSFSIESEEIQEDNTVVITINV